MANEAAVTADYGLDAPGVVKSMFVRAGVAHAFGVAIWLMNRTLSPDHALSVLLALGITGLIFLGIAVVMIWSSRVGKLQLRDRLLGQISLSGDEKVLDVGCGRGLLLIGAAKRLTSGKATGVDVWSEEDLSGNSADAVRANAKAEGVADKVRLDDADARKLPFANDSFDVVLSSLAIHNMDDSDDRRQAIAEIVRVLKPGGRLAVFDILHAAEYAKELRERGMSNVTLSGLSFLWCMPGRTVTANKP